MAALSGLQMNTFNNLKIKEVNQCYPARGKQLPIHPLGLVGYITIQESTQRHADCRSCPKQQLKRIIQKYYPLTGLSYPGSSTTVK